MLFIMYRLKGIERLVPSRQAIDAVGRSCVGGCMSKTIMLIHGAWLNARSWEGFKARYES
jgi:hypothetical protein